VVIVTGAARGLGREACVAFAHEGAKVVAADVLSCADTVGDVQRAGGDCLEVTTDVSSATETQTLAAKALERFDRIDVLVNNAAVLPRMDPFEEISEEEWDRVMSVNLKGMWLVSKAVVPVMRARSGGRIINLTSNAVSAGVPFMLHYVTSKGAIVASPVRSRASSGTPTSTSTRCRQGSHSRPAHSPSQTRRR
jgi:3-oxoacyl-[acyl-carrier protein] reductase